LRYRDFFPFYNVGVGRENMKISMEREYLRENAHSIFLVFSSLYPIYGMTLEPFGLEENDDLKKTGN
jgi:hypothetical protein